MGDTPAKIRIGKYVFETMVDMDSALKFKKGEISNIDEVIRDDTIWTDMKKGLRAGNGELLNAFETTDFKEIVEKIVKKGEIKIDKAFRDEVLENKKKQIIDFLTKYAIDVRTGNPFTYDTISNAIEQAGTKIENLPVEKQIKRILESLNKIIPIKIETKKILAKIPAEYTGRVYGIIKEYKEKENWLSDGSLEVVLNIPVGLQSEFYDKLNSFTHGSAITSEVKE